MINKKCECLEKIVKEKRMPVLFIGSGFSKRYLNNYPVWKELLMKIAKKININKDQFIAYEQQIKTNNTKISVGKLNAQLAQFIQKKLLENIINGYINIKDLLNEEELKLYYNDGVDCFKLLVAKEFKKYEINKNKLKEIECFKNIKDKISTVLTTNYDKFLEEMIFEDSVVFKTQDEMYFAPNTNYAEIYKIHGDLNNIESLIITENDYYFFEENLKLLTAKILVLLSSFPILFIGYSLSDENIKKIFYDFFSSFSDEIRNKIKDKLIFVKYQKSVNDLIEGEKVFQYNGSDITVKTITTDNYCAIYNILNKIKPNLTAHEIRESKKQINNIIENVEKGKKGFSIKISNGNNNNNIIYIEDIVNIKDKEAIVDDNNALKNELYRLKSELEMANSTLKNQNYKKGIAPIFYSLPRPSMISARKRNTRSYVVARRTCNAKKSHMSALIKGYYRSTKRR